MITFTDMFVVGYIPQFLREDSPLSARDQIAGCYVSGWRPFHGFRLEERDDKYALHYPGDPPMRELSRGMMREELLVFFQGSWLAIIQPDGSWEVSRLD